MNTLKYLLSPILFMSLSSYTLAQLELQVNVMPPYPVRLSDYTDIESRVFVTVSNSTNNPYEIILYGRWEAGSVLCIISEKVLNW